MAKEPEYLVTNTNWKTEFYCMAHETPVKMVVKEGLSKFFACPKYMLKDEKHPDGYDPDYENSCDCRISFDDIGGTMMKFSEIIGQAYADGEVSDFDGMTFNYKSVKVKVLHHDDIKGTRFGILQKNALRSR